jgi:hypothetical protein
MIAMLVIIRIVSIAMGTRVAEGGTIIGASLTPEMIRGTRGVISRFHVRELALLEIPLNHFD